MAASYDAPELTRPAVEVIQVAGEWYVRVVGPRSEVVRTFAVESRAIDFAAEQCLRLGLEKYDRV
jgi:hypothetical protein